MIRLLASLLLLSQIITNGNRRIFSTPPPSSYYIPSSGNSASGFFSCSVATGVSIPVGALVFVISNGAAFPTDSFNTYTQFSGQAIWYTVNGHAGVLTISLSGGPELQSCGTAAYASPVTGTLDGSPITTSPWGGLPATYGPLTTTNSNDTLILAGGGNCSCSGGAMIPTPAGWVLDYSDLNYIFFYSRNVSSTGSYSLTLTIVGGSGGPATGGNALAAFEN